MVSQYAALGESSFWQRYGQKIHLYDKRAISPVLVLMGFNIKTASWRQDGYTIQRREEVWQQFLGVGFDVIDEKICVCFRQIPSRSSLGMFFPQYGDDNDRLMNAFIRKISLIVTGS